jgi:hypothetical protein
MSGNVSSSSKSPLLAKKPVQKPEPAQTWQGNTTQNFGETTKEPI